MARKSSPLQPKRTSTTRSRGRASEKTTDRVAEQPDTAADMWSRDASASPQPAVYDPSYQEIAEAAYHRYLSRGAQHGGDFDDWVEAERDLRSRRVL